MARSKYSILYIVRNTALGYRVQSSLDNDMPRAMYIVQYTEHSEQCKALEQGTEYCTCLQGARRTAHYHRCKGCIQSIHYRTWKVL